MSITKKITGKVVKKIVLSLGLGWTLLLLLCLVLFGGGVLAVAGAVSSTPDQEAILVTGLSPEVEQYRELVTLYCQQYGIPDYVDLALAILQQESGGQGADPMQSSECPYNTKYPKQPNGITDATYSVDCGCQYLASCLQAAKVGGPTDMTAISLALQGYNFGNGYIPWALQRGGYTLQNAAEFSALRAAELGWKQYGDPLYVPHTLRYYSIGGIPATPDGYLTHPLPNGTYEVSSPYGQRPSGFHHGIDFAAPLGTAVHATESGTVTVSQFGSQGSGYYTYGYVVVIDHGNGFETLYAHNSQLLVQVGEKVIKGQRIALVGSTGNSTGPHCHFEVRKNGERTDPTPYLQLTEKIR